MVTVANIFTGEGGIHDVSSPFLVPPDEMMSTGSGQEHSYRVFITGSLHTRIVTKDECRTGELFRASYIQCALSSFIVLF